MSSYVIVCRRTDNPKVRPWFSYEREDDWSDRCPGSGWPPKSERYGDKKDAKKALSRIGLVPELFNCAIVPVTKGMRRELRVGVHYR